MVAISSTHLRGEETEAQESKINKSQVHSQRQRQSQDQNSALLLRPSPEPLLLHRSKSGPYFRLYLPRTIINQFIHYPKCPSDWETINFLQTSLGVLPFSQRKNNFFSLYVRCVCVCVCLFFWSPSNKNHIEA